MIRVQNLHFTYPGNEVETIKGIDFEVAPGEVFGFLGPNGAGKSTIQKILIGILKQFRGSVRVQNTEMRSAGSAFYEKIGVAFEQPNLYSKFTALENLRFFSTLYRHATADPLELLAAVGLESEAQTRVAAFSKGMKMRLNFCRALLNHPDVLFFDEPTAGLDPVNLQKIKALILAQKKHGRTICITTHDMHVADSLCDRIAFIVDGKIALIDSPRALKLQFGARRVRIDFAENGTLQHAIFELNQLGHNQKFLEILRHKQIETMHTQEATLEDIFIQTTGRKLA